MKKESRPPPGTPDIGDHVRLRGRDVEGKLLSVNDRKWSRVDWFGERKGPVICHLFELERLSG